MEYNGFEATIEYFSDDGIFVGRVLGLGPSHIMSFHGSSIKELKSAFKDSIDQHLELSENKRKPDPHQTNNKSPIRKRSIILVSLFMIVLVQAGFAQNTKTLILPKPTPEPTKIDPPPGSMQLLDGYIHTKTRGFDTKTGEIKKADGMKITYDIGFLASNQAFRIFAREDSKSWLKIQKVNGMTLYLVGGEDNRLVATFPEPCAIFKAQVTNEEQVADFMLMIMTYKPVINKNRMPKPKMISGMLTC